MAKKLEVRNLSISFRTNNGAVRAVRDISFDLNEGETLAIAGESGSGKSVTTRAIMGILAGNAMVEDGEIIYDGRDLLKIPEEDFHTLRGHRLSMVFQDPLSALNPIMRIGKQLTEAMILNNKERRADGRKRFNQTLAELEKNMTAAGVENARGKCQELNRFTVEAVKMENAWQSAREQAVSMTDAIEEADLALLKKEEKTVREIAGRIAGLEKSVRNPWLIPAEDGAFGALTGKIGSLGKGFTMEREGEFRAALEELKKRLADALDETAEAPNFFRIGYLTTHGGQADPARESVAAINGKALEALDGGFMKEFLRDAEKALAHSAAESEKRKAHAVQVLKDVLPVFEKDALNEKECREAAKRAGEAVDQAIDRLALDKDNRAWVFHSSLDAYIDRYFYGVKHNPKEQKRFDRETEAYNRETARGKFMPTVVPLNLVDMEKARGNLTGTVSRMIDHFSGADAGTADLSRRAVRMVDYLKDRASEYAYHLSKPMAKHRAIELMKEVGIPEPQRRYHQYPFEFSGGMRQRIVIAIALSANPDILICDEPTTALDVTIQAQILDLINRLKRERNLSVIFITHDLGVVANMADRIAIMYAGKIVEYGTADDVFYDPKHPYTWALLASMPDLETKEKLAAIPGTPPNMILPPKGDAFAARNHYAMEIDLEEQPPMFRVSETHWAATWLLHPKAPKVERPAIVTERIERMRRREAARNDGTEKTETTRRDGAQQTDAVKGGEEA